MPDEKKPTMVPTGLMDAIDCLSDLDRALERDDLEVSKHLLRALVGHTAWLSDYDEFFESLDTGKLDTEACMRWVKWQLGNLRLEAVLDEPTEPPGMRLRDTKPYPNAVAHELIESSTRTTAQRNAVRPNHGSLDEDTEGSVDDEVALDSLDDLISDIVKG